MISEFDFGWLIGILEGEGHFSIHQNSTPRMTIEMTDEDTMLRVLDLLQRITGQRHPLRYVERTEESRKNYSPTWALALYGRNALKVMRVVVRHMQWRRRQQIWRTLNGYKPLKLYLDKDAILSAVRAKHPAKPMPTAIIVPIERRL